MEAEADADPGIGHRRERVARHRPDRQRIHHRRVPEDYDGRAAQDATRAEEEVLLDLQCAREDPAAPILPKQSIMQNDKDFFNIFNMVKVTISIRFSEKQSTMANVES